MGLSTFGHYFVTPSTQTQTEMKFFWDTCCMFSGILAFASGCYYNHELRVEHSAGCPLLFKWRDVASGPFPGIGFQVSGDGVSFELEGDDLTAVTAGGKKFEFSVPFTLNKVDLHDKSLCDWSYGCAHCQHVAGDACSRRLYAISAVYDHLGELVDDDIEAEDDDILNAAFQTMVSDLSAVCDEYPKSDEFGEEYLTNDIVEACSATCLKV